MTFQTYFRFTHYVPMLPLALLATTSLASELNIESEIKGQQAQPKVLFILPWQQQKEVELNLDIENLSHEDFLSPVERSSFQRETTALKRLEVSQEKLQSQGNK